MSQQGHNAPPYISLELSEEETKWIYEKLCGLGIDNQAAFRDVCQMPSSDPRAVMRSALTMKLACEASNYETILDRFEEQQPDLKDIAERLNEFAVRNTTQGAQ